MDKKYIIDELVRIKDATEDGSLWEDDERIQDVLETIHSILDAVIAEIKKEA